MSKSFVDKMIHNMKLADMLVKVSPWMIEGIRDMQKNIRYAGVSLKDEWADILPKGNNLLLKFVVDRNSGYIEFYIANKPPFFNFQTKQFSENDKWEVLLGELKRKLKRDKEDFMNHKEVIGNLYVKIKPFLR